MNTYTACTCIYSLVIFIFILVMMPGLYYMYLQTRNFDQNYSLDLIYVKEIFLILILHIKHMVAI